MLFLGAMSAAAFLLFINGPDIVTSHEARVALPARRMAASGWPWSAKPVEVPQVRLVRGAELRLVPDPDQPPMVVNPWLVPVLNGQIRLQKPPLPYWCSGILIRIFGFSEWVVRLIPALMGAIAVFLIYDLGRQFFGRSVGWLAALVWVSTYAIPEMYRKAMADPYLAFFTLLCVWAWVRATERGLANLRLQISDYRFQMAGKRSAAWGWLLLFYISLGIALLAKGPPALINILVPLLAYHACLRRPMPGGPATLSPLIHGAGLLLALAIAVPWPAYILRHVPHALDQWRYESIGELSDNTNNARPWWFYIPELFYLSIPWTPLWVAACALPFLKQRRRSAKYARPLATSASASTQAPTSARDLSSDPKPHIVRSDYRLWFPLAWWFAIVIFFSFVNLKKNQYLLPALPAESLMIALALRTLLAWARHLRFQREPGTLIAVQAIIGIGFAIALGGLIAIDAGFSFAWMAIPALLVALIPVRSMFRRLPRRWIAAQSLAYVFAIVCVFRLYVRPSENDRSAKAVAAEMLALSRQPDHTILVPKLPEEVAVYLPLGLQYGFGTKVLTIVDDSRGARQRRSRKLPTASPNPETFQRLVPDAKLVAVRQLNLKSAPEDGRWKVYELTVKRTGLARGRPQGRVEDRG